MSHKFSFLQAFLGYDPAKSILLVSALRRNVMLNILQVACQVGLYRSTEIILLADMGKFQTQICQRLRSFNLISDLQANIDPSIFRSLKFLQTNN